MNYIVKCPICGKKFNVKNPSKHINAYHPDASEQDLIAIRDARRSLLGKPIKTHHKTKHYLLKNITKHDGKKPFSGGLPSLGKKR
ncbi:MAG TPA: hypothetical protein ACHBZA_14385 [Arsenophonus apicola]|uniref:hypothetical protein n=1 Tax=Arsenophonus apicola TaxID=2879119 RepID=UPI001CDD67D0|nr:hypothetical protein [Arsenophonus apicola]UBX28501.1 hypothetical protein LDL57_11895 [Arsenophonus apicola]